MSTPTSGPADGGQRADRVHVLIAVKGLDGAKTRLARDFSAAERHELVLSMFRDTVTATRAVDHVASITVVTPDADVSAAATDLGAGVLAEPSADASSTLSPLNRALSHAAEELHRRGARDLLALQADLPALTTDELIDALDTAPAGRRSYVADHRTVGTAALFVRDGGELAPAFGESSARRHGDSGAVALAGVWPGLRLDVDTVDDLELAYRRGVGEATRASLAAFGWTVDKLGSRVRRSS